MIEVTVATGTAAPLWPERAGVTCCDLPLVAGNESGPLRAYCCPACGTTFNLLVKPQRRVA